MVFPSKELLFEVIDDLSPRVVEVIDIYQDNLLSTYYDCGKGEPTCLGYEINIYELMHIMKDFIGKRYSCFGTTKSSSVIGWFLWIDEEDIRFIAETEFEAVTKACEWILEQQK